MIKKFSLYIALSFLTISVFGEELRIERLFGAEHPGPYKHPASITELDNGDLYLAYYGGSGEYGDDTAVYGARLKQGESSWSFPKVIADTPSLSEGNPVVWQAPDGIVWLFYVNRYGPTWSSSRVKGKLSLDGAYTWSDSFMLTFELGSMVRGQPILSRNGDYLLPMYHETGEDTEFIAPDASSYFMRYNPSTKTWKPTNRIRSSMGNLQPQAVQIDDNYLICYLRRGGNYEPTDKGYILRAESRDGGFTWTDAKPTKFPNPNAAVDFIRLQNGHLFLVYNNSMNDRTPLTAAISTDNDVSYPYRRDICKGDNTFAYPYAIQTRDGKIHVVFTTNNRTVIQRAVFEEKDILNCQSDKNE
ncbi:MAG: sialidase family protein [Candidatus Omnitrophota bacterium]